MQKLNTLVMTMHKQMKLFLCFVFVFLLIGSVSALKKNYIAETKTTEVYDGLIVKTKYADIQLKTFLNVRVPAGYGKVAEFEINSKKDYLNAINSIDLYDKNKGMEKFSRDYDLKYKVNAIVWVNDTEIECETNSYANGTTYETCEEIVVGQHQEEQEMWLDFTTKNIIRGSKYTLGIFTDVHVGDKVEWIPNFFDNEIRVEEWASWTADLNVGLENYYKLDEQDTTGSGTIIDSIQNNNGTNGGTDNSSGKINTAYGWDSDTDEIDLGTTPFDFDSGEEWSIAFWYNSSTLPEDSTDRSFLTRIEGGGSYNGLDFSFRNKAAPDKFFQLDARGSSDQHHAEYDYAFTDGDWHLIILIFDGSNVGTLWVDNSTITRTASTGSFSGTAPSVNAYIGNRDSLNTGMRGFFDEVGIWNRSLNEEEINQLWNNGNGISYISITQINPTITINTPTNTTYNYEGIPLNCTATHNVGVGNMTATINWTTDTGATHSTTYTNSSGGVGINLSYYQAEFIHASGQYNFSCYAESMNDTNANEIVYYTVDLESPIVNITNPTENQLIQNKSENISFDFNFTATDTNLDDCWYNYTNENTLSFNDTTNLPSNWMDGDNLTGATPVSTTNFTINVPNNELNGRQLYIYDTDEDQWTGSLYGCNATNNLLFINVTVTGSDPYTNHFYCNDRLIMSSGSQGGMLMLPSIATIGLRNVASSNIILPSCANTTLTLPSTSQSISLCANDTANNINCTSARSFTLNEITETESYNASVLEETDQQFNLTIGVSTYFDSLEGNLSYNGTETTCDVDNRTLVCDKVIPSVDGTENFSLSFTYLINDEEFTSETFYQTILNFTSIEVSTTGCSAGLTQVLEFDFKSENNITSLNTTGAYIFRYGLSENASLRTSNGNYTNADAIYLCVNTTLSNTFYMGYGELQYQEHNQAYTERRYYVFTGTRLTNTSINNTAYSLNNAESTSFLMTIQNSELSPYVGKYLALQRWYPEFDNYINVELAKTDDEGETVIKLETENVDYRIAVYEPNGTIIHLTSPFRLTCLTSPCSYTITVPTSGTNLFDREEGLDVSLTYNETTGIVLYTYSDPTQTTQNMTLNVYQETGTSNVLICTDSATGYFGVMSCNVSGYTGLVRAVGFRTASPSTAVISKLLNLAQTAIDNGFAMFITLIVTALLVFVGIASPILGVILTVVGFIPALVFGFLPLGIIMAVMCLGFTVIYFMKKA